MESERGFIIKAFIFIILILLILNLLGFLLNSYKPEIIKPEDEKNVFLTFENSTLVKMKLPAVNNEGEGVITELRVEKTKGSGRTLTEIDNLLFWADTQHSIRIAKMVAGNITGKDLNQYDIVYTVEANASIIGGPSAGAALAIATISALLEKPTRDDVMITGSINSDGSIGPVSEVYAKAKAAKEYGAKIFLVPPLQNRDFIYETVKSCEKFGVAEVCTTETRPVKINITEEIGVKVHEVANIEEAMNYFFG